MILLALCRPLALALSTCTPSFSRVPKRGASLRAAAPGLAACLIASSSSLGCAHVPHPQTGPEALSVTSRRIPQIVSSDGPANLKVLVAERPNTSVVSVQVAFRSGLVDEPEGKEGTALLAYTVLASRASEIVAASSRGCGFGATDRPSVSIYSDGASLTATVLRSDLDTVIENMARAIATPRIDDAALDRAKLSSLVLTSREPWQGAPHQVDVARSLLGPKTELALSPRGSPASRARIGVEDVRGFLEHGLNPDGMAVIVVGPVSAADVLASVEEHFGPWARERGRSSPSEFSRAHVTAPSPSQLPGLSRRTGRRVSLAETESPPLEGGPRRLVVALAGDMNPRDPFDEAVLRLAEQALGGALRFRLREEAGLSYRVLQELWFHEGGGLLAASALLELGDLSRGEVAARRALTDASRMTGNREALDALRRGAINVLMNDLDTVCGLGAAASRIFRAGLPEDHLRDVAAAIERAPHESLRLALSRAFSSSQSKVLVTTHRGRG